MLHPVRLEAFASRPSAHCAPEINPLGLAEVDRDHASGAVSEHAVERRVRGMAQELAAAQKLTDGPAP